MHRPTGDTASYFILAPYHSFNVHNGASGKIIHAIYLWKRTYRQDFASILQLIAFLTPACSPSMVKSAYCVHSSTMIVASYLTKNWISFPTSLIFGVDDFTDVSAMLLTPKSRAIALICPPYIFRTFVKNPTSMHFPSEQASNTHGQKTPNKLMHWHTGACGAYRPR